jgi:hypothetical protein
MHVSTPAGARLTIQLAGRAGAIQICFALEELSSVKLCLASEKLGFMQKKTPSRVWGEKKPALSGFVSVTFCNF